MKMDRFFYHKLTTNKQYAYVSYIKLKISIKIAKILIFYLDYKKN